MATLRSRVIRLAHEKPELRPHLLPLLKEASFIPYSPGRVDVEGSRKTYLPGNNPTLMKRKNTPDGFEVWTWEVSTRLKGTTYHAIVWSGNLVKPVWHDFFSSAGDREKKILRTLQTLLKTADLSLRRDKITIPLATGGTETLDALVFGPWSIYKSLRGSGYTVTFTPTGQAVTSSPKTLMDAKGFLDAMIAAAPDLARANDTGDIMRHKDVIMGLIKNPPALSGTAKKPPVELVSEKREKLIDEIRRLGLASYGTRYGKAGEFFAKRMSGRMGDSPTRAISVGRKEVLKNEFYMRDERWGMADTVLISAMTPELLKEWVDWTKEGPSRGELRKQ